MPLPVGILAFAATSTTAAFAAPATVHAGIAARGHVLLLSFRAKQQHYHARAFAPMPLRCQAQNAAADAARAQVQPPTDDESQGGGSRVLGAVLNLALFGAFFGALMTVVRHAAMENTVPHERIILVALAVILPDLARFSFSALTDSPNALRKARNPDHVAEEGFKSHFLLCWITTAFKLLGFYIAGLTPRVALGAGFVIIGQLLVNSLVQLRILQGTIFRLRRADRTGVILLELLGLVLLACSHFGMYPIMSAALFLSVVTMYWLAKYDVDLFGGQ